MNVNNPSNLNKAVIYCRVSTKEQVEEGNSLRTQENICREYACKHEYQIANIFIEQGESAKTADRTELKKLLAYCSTKSNGIKAIIIYKIDRLSRNTDDYSQLRILLKKYGVEIKSTSEHFENNPVGRFMENTMANIAQFDNDIRTERSVGGMREATRDGRYVWKAPIGYNNVRIASRATIAPDETRAPFIQRIFALVSTGAYPIQEVRRIITEEGLQNRQGKPLSTSYFYDILTNELYAGWIEKFGEKHKGKFEAIVSEEVFNQVQRVLKRKGRKNPSYITDNPDFPLRRFVINENGKKLTGSWSKGRYKKYPFYRFGGNKHSFNRDKFEEDFMNYADKFSFNPEKFAKLKILVKENLVNSTINQRKERERLNKSIKDLTNKQSDIITKNLNGFISDNVLKLQLAIIEDELYESYKLLATFSDTKNDFEDCWDILEEFLKKPSKTWKNAKINPKLKLQWFQFPKGVTFENKLFGTTEISRLFNAKKVISTWVFANVNSGNEISNNTEITIKELKNNNKAAPNEYWKHVGREITELTEILKEIKGFPK